MSEYRINVRFNPDDPEDAKLLQYLESVQPSRNKLIKAAILHYSEYLCGRQQESQLLENIRQMFREEVTALPQAMEREPILTPALPAELTEEQREQSAAAALDFLSNF